MVLAIAVTLGISIALLLGIAIGGFLHSSLTDAHTHENRLLPFLHVFVIGCVVFFFVERF